MPRVTDVYAALPSMTGKFELEYEGELKGAETVARELVRGAVANVAEGYLSHLDPRQVIEWFDLGGSLQLGDTMSAGDVLARAARGAGAGRAGARGRRAEATRRRRCWPPGIDFVLEGLYATQEDQPQRRARLPRQPSTPVRRPARETVAREEEPAMPPSGGGRRSITTEGDRVSRVELSSG